MKYLRAYLLFIMASTLFIIHQLVEPFIHQPIIDSYLDDILFLPVVYSIVLVLMRPFTSSSFILPVPMMFLGWATTSFFTEWLFPLLSPQHTADLLDVLAYALGGVLFAVFGNKPVV